MDPIVRANRAVLRPAFIGLMQTALLSGLAGCILPPTLPPETPLLQVVPSDADDTPPLEVVARTAIFDAIPGKVGSHAPAIAVLPDNQLLAAWFSYDGPEELNGSAIYMSRAAFDPDANSASWSAPMQHVDRPEADGNPVLYAEGDRVWFFQAVVPFGWSTSGAVVQQSFDAGQTWSSARQLSGPLGTNVRFPPIRLPSDILVLPAYDDLLQRALFFTSADDGNEWVLRSDIATGNLFQRLLQPSVVTREDGSLFTVMRPAGEVGRAWGAIGDANAEQWTQPVRGNLVNPGSPAALLRLQSGRLLMVFNDSATIRRPLSASLSDDDGSTWGTPVVLVDDPGAHSYPSLAQSPDGTIHVVFSEARQRIGHLQLREP